ncbi:MAG: hypothetical protein Q4B17_09825 [Lautropia sp.]|nr:hypothetical protein [Lautropia sp.]
MLIVIIAWLYVVLLMSLTEHAVAAGIMTFLLYGLLPLSVVLYLLDTPARRARKRRQAAENAAQAPEPSGHLPTEAAPPPAQTQDDPARDRLSS